MSKERYRNLSNRDEAADFGFAMVRPDGLALALDEAIIDRIESAGLSIVKRKLFVLRDTQVDRIYSDLSDRNFYPDFKKSLVGKHVMGMLVGGHRDVSDRLMEVKGSVWDNKGTVRGDFSLAHLLSGDELELFKAGELCDEHLPPGVATDIMRYDRMHCEEDADGARRAINAVYVEKEIEEASMRFSQLPRFLSATRPDSDALLGIEQPS